MKIQRSFLLCCQQVDICGFELNISETVRCIAMKCGADIHVPLWMNRHNSSHSTIFSPHCWLLQNLAICRMIRQSIGVIHPSNIMKIRFCNISLLVLFRVINEQWQPLTVCYSPNVAHTQHISTIIVSTSAWWHCLNHKALLYLPELLA